MDSNAKRAGYWGLGGWRRPGRRKVLREATASTRALQETRRSILRKLALHFAKEHGAED